MRLYLSACARNSFDVVRMTHDSATGATLSKHPRLFDIVQVARDLPTGAIKVNGVLTIVGLADEF